MSQKTVYNSVSYNSSLENRTIWGGVYTSDIIILAVVGWIDSVLFGKYGINTLYIIIAVTCIPTYIFLLFFNNYLPKQWLLFAIRKTLGLNRKSIEIKGVDSQWS